MSLLKSFDIFYAAGGPDIGIAEDFPVTADGNGNVTVLFSLVKDNPKVSGVELYQVVPLPQPPPDFTIDLDTSAITLSPASGNVPGGGLSESMVTAILLNGETALHRQIDKAVRLLGRDVPRLFEGRARRQALADLDQTERCCRTDADLDVALRTNDYLQFCPVQNLDYERQDMAF